MQEDDYKTISFPGVIVGMVGFALLLSVDWRIAVGAFLMLLAITLSKDEEE